MSKLKEIYYFYKKKGLADTLRRLRSRIFSVTTFRVNICELNSECEGITVDPEYKIIIDDLAALDQLRSEVEGLPREFYIDRTHKAKRFYLLVHGKEPAFIHWVFGKGEYSRFCKIQDDVTVELQYGYTMPSFRGKRLVAKALNYTCNDLRKKGFKRVINVVSEGNVSCHRGMEFSGLKEYTKVKSYFSYVKKVTIPRYK